VASRVQADRTLLDARALAALVVAAAVGHDLVGVDVGVVIEHRDGQRVPVDLPRHEVANHEVVAFEDLVHRRRLTDAAGDRLVVGDAEDVRVEAAVPADDVEPVLRAGVHRPCDAARAPTAVLDVDVDIRSTPDDGGTVVFDEPARGDCTSAPSGLTRSSGARLRRRQA
jgi:hypothetical protein